MKNLNKKLRRARGTKTSFPSGSSLKFPRLFFYLRIKYPLTNELCNSITFGNVEVRFGVVKKDYTNITTVIFIYYTSSNIYKNFPC